MARTTNRDHAIEARWRRWQPWCLVKARETRDPASTLAWFRTSHRSRCLAARDAGITWQSIIRAELDDPRLTDSRWEFAFRGAVERRRSRMGRVKGQCLPRYQERRRKKEQRHAHPS